MGWQSMWRPCALNDIVCEDESALDSRADWPFSILDFLKAIGSSFFILNKETEHLRCEGACSGHSLAVALCLWGQTSILI